MSTVRFDVRVSGTCEVPDVFLETDDAGDYFNPHSVNDWILERLGSPGDPTAENASWEVDDWSEESA